MNHRVSRFGYFARALGTIAVGLGVHSGVNGMNADVRDVVGDALWAMMMVWWVSMLAPAARWWIRAGVALAICYGVETSQLFHSIMLDQYRATVPGRLVLGSGFAWRDFGSYAIGVACAAAFDALLRRRTARAD